MENLNVVYLPVTALTPYERNAKEHPPEQVEQIKKSIQDYGMRDPIGIWGPNNIIVEGHGRLLACKALGMTEVPCIRLDDMTDEQRREYALVHNQTTMNSPFDVSMLDLEIADLTGFDAEFYGFEVHDGEYNRLFPGELREMFIAPPFSVLDARNGEWQKRKRLWHTAISSGNGRSDNLLGEGLLKLAKRSKAEGLSGTSIFDPVLCEVLINWYCPKGGKILDPFAGGSVRGVVSNFLGRHYYGNDLSATQIEANEKQAELLAREENVYGEPWERPKWFVGDSLKIDEIIPERDFDMILTCPPYADLEKYSNDPADLSNMDYDDFLATYAEIIRKSAGMLKENAFAAIVVGEVRDKKGIYRNFIGDTIEAAKAAGLKYYNELILVTSIGTWSLRARKQFTAARKVVNTHQKALIFFNSKTDADMVEVIKSFDEYRDCAETKESILCFVKGDPKEASFPVERYNFEDF